MIYSLQAIQPPPNQILNTIKMEEIFFDTTYSNLPQLLLRIFSFLLASSILLYLIYFLLAKIMFRKSVNPREVNLRLVFLWAIMTYFLLFNVYLYFLFYRNGTGSFQWTNISFYLGILAQLIIYMGVLAYFFIKRHALKRIINDKSTN